jgi:hypothetical protein
VEKKESLKRQKLENLNFLLYNLCNKQKQKESTDMRIFFFKKKKNLFYRENLQSHLKKNENRRNLQSPLSSLSLQMANERARS